MSNYHVKNKEKVKKIIDQSEPKITDSTQSAEYNTLYAKYQEVLIERDQKDQQCQNLKIELDDFAVKLEELKSAKGKTIVNF